MLLLLALAGCLNFAWLGKLPLVEPDEGRNAEVAREMLASHNWLTPHYNSFPYLDKPPVFFWAVAASFRLWGPGEWAARAPSALLGLLTVLLVWFLARRLYGESSGLRAAIVFATCPLVLALSRQVIFDMALTFFLTLALTAFWLAEASDFQSGWPDVLLFLALGFGTLTKGPVGFILPLLTILAYAALRRNVGELKRLRWLLGVALFLVVVLPWFVAVSLRYPDFPRYALWQESLARFSTGMAHRQGGLFYYVPVYLGGLFPWSLFLLFAAWSRRKRWRELRQNRSTLFLLVWVGVTFLFFSASHSQLPGYFLPAALPLSILMGQVWGELQNSTRAPDWLTAGFAALLGLGLLTALASRPWILAVPTAHWGKKLHPAILPLLKPSLLYSGIILTALAVIGRNLSARARGASLSRTTFLVVALTVPLLVLRWRTAIQDYAEAHSSRQLAETILASPEKDWPLYGYYYFRTSLPFYLGRPVGLISFDASELTSNYVVNLQREMREPEHPAAEPSHARSFVRLDQNPLDHRLLVDIMELMALARASAQPRLIMVRNSHVALLAHDLGGIEPLWNAWDFSIWEVRGAEGGAGESGKVIGPFEP